MNKKRILPIFIIVFTNVLGGSIILPILPLLAEDTFGATVFQATAIATAFFAAQFFAAPIMGRMSDRMGRRPLLLASQVGTVIAFLIFIFAAELGAWIDTTALSLGMSGGLLMLYIARTLDGITGGNISIAQAYISDVSDEKSRTQALGLIGAAFGLGIVFGPAIGSLVAPINLRAPFIIAALLTVLSLMLTYFTLPESLPIEKRSAPGQAAQADTTTRSFLTTPAIFAILLVVFVYMSTFSVLVTTFSLFANRVLFPEITELGQVIWYVGFILSFFGIVSALTQAVLLPLLLKRLSERVLILTGLLCLGVGFAGLALVQSVWVVVILILPLSFGMGVLQPCLQALLTYFGDQKTNGRLLGLFESARSLAFIFAPLWSGFMFEQFNPQSPYAIAAGLTFVGFLLTLFLIRQPLTQSETLTGAISS